MSQAWDRTFRIGDIFVEDMYVKKALGEMSGSDAATASTASSWPYGRSLTGADQPMTKVTACEWRGVADHQ